MPGTSVTLLGLANITLKALINWDFEEIGAVHPFGKNKTAELRTWQRDHRHANLADITADYLSTFVRNRRKTGASGMTIGIDLTYLGSMLSQPATFEKFLSRPEAITRARANMPHLKISTKSKECARRPTRERNFRSLQLLG